MTLSVLWRSDGRLHMASDSRMSFGVHGHADVGVKVMRLPIRIVGAELDDRDSLVVLFERTYGFCYAGSLANAATFKQFMEDLLLDVQYVSPDVPLSFDELCRFLCHFCAKVSTEVVASLTEAGRYTFFVAGLCPQVNRLRGARFHLTQADGRSDAVFEEVVTGDGQVVAVGTGTAQFDAAMGGQAVTMRNVLLAVNRVIDEGAVQTVGGDIQYGSFRPDGNFTVSGFTRISLQEADDEGRHAVQASSGCFAIAASTCTPVGNLWATGSGLPLGSSSWKCRRTRIRRDDLSSTADERLPGSSGLADRSPRLVLTAHLMPPGLDGRLGGLSIVSQGQAHVQDSGGRWRLHIDESCRDLVEGVCRLKEALDHMSRWPEDGEKYAWIQEQLRRVGLQPSDFTGETMVRGMGMPHGFLKVLVGSWFTYQDNETFRDVAEIPEWSVVGWVRKDQYRGTAALPHPEIVAKAQVVQSNHPTGEEVTTWGFEGVPLLWAGEGKNRTQLFRLAGMPRLSKLVLYKLPDVTKLVASPMYGVPGVTVLRGGGTTEVLPFGDLSRRLLTALGVRWSDKPSVDAWFHLRTPDDEPVGLRHIAQLALDRRKVRLALIGSLRFSGLKHRS